MIRNVTLDDAKQLVEIYNHYIENTTITFETERIDEEEMRRRIAAISAEYPYFVYEKNGQAVAYCYVSQWKKKHAYHQSVESTIYVQSDCTHQGIGRKLMIALIDELKKRQIHAIIACITIPNPESVGLHESLGFKQVSHFEQVGRKFDKWLDVGDWELIL